MEYNRLHHNLDVTHIGKNIYDNLWVSLLNLEENSKDNLNARKDLEVMNIRQEPHPIALANNKYELSTAPYTFSSEEKTRL